MHQEELPGAQGLRGNSLPAIYLVTGNGYPRKLGQQRPYFNLSVNIVSREACGE